MKTLESVGGATEESLHIGALAQAKSSLREAVQELEQEVSRQNAQLTRVVQDIKTQTTERDALAAEAERLRHECETLRERVVTSRTEINTYRAQQVESIERAGQASDERIHAAEDAERVCASREQAAQTAEASYHALLDRVSGQREAVRAKVADAIEDALTTLFPLG